MAEDFYWFGYKIDLFLTNNHPDTYRQSMTKDFGDIPVASKWNCPFFRATGKGFLKDTVTSTFPFSVTVPGDA